ncbi:hypothetical protein LP420_23445 [Massilia sp. B-10]|nr:hypothetical protein LP420_23445 [Massilia sp. B-10]
MMYPAVGGLAGLLVGIATHAAMSSGLQSAEKQKLREQADAILLPHKDLLATYLPLELSQAALPQLTAVQDKRLLAQAAVADADEVALETVPVFYLTQDRRADPGKCDRDPGRRQCQAARHHHHSGGVGGCPPARARPGGSMNRHSNCGRTARDVCPVARHRPGRRPGHARHGGAVQDRALHRRRCRAHGAGPGAQREVRPDRAAHFARQPDVGAARAAPDAGTAAEAGCEAGAQG